MFEFDLKTTRIYQAVEWLPVFKLVNLLKKVFGILCILVFLLFVIVSIGSGFSFSLLGVFVIVLTFFIMFWWETLFFELRLKKPKIKMTLEDAVKSNDEVNMAEFLSFDSARAASKLKRTDSSALFYFLITHCPKLNFIFSRAVLDINEIEKMLKKEMSKTSEVSQEDFQKVILSAAKSAIENKHQKIEVGDIVIALSEHNKIFNQILIKHKLAIQDIKNLVWWLESIEGRIKEQKKWWEYKNLVRRGTLARSWSSAYTITLDKYSRDWEAGIRARGFEQIIGHENEVKSAERILARLKINNVLLVGQPGVGRGSVIQALAQKSFFGEAIKGLNYKRFIELNLSKLIAQIESKEETEAVLDKVFQEATSAGNVILVIDDFHNFIKGVGGILSSYLEFPNFQIIAMTSYAGLHEYIEKNPSLMSLFEKVEVSEVSERETIKILENSAMELEIKYGKIVSYPAIRDIFKYSKRYIADVPFPKKAIDVLDEIMVYVSHRTECKIVLPEHVAKIMSIKTEIPVGEVEETEKEMLLNLEDLIHQRIINQDKAVKEISDSLRRARAEVVKRKKPIGCFLFLGPTGVGKTETAKAVADIYFKSEERMIRMDMSEFQKQEDISRLIGSSKTQGLLTTKVREDPFSLVLLDEIEKAHPDILNLFLQVLDEGYVTDYAGRKISFLNTIIIATSNAGYKIILEAIEQKTEWQNVKQKLFNYLFEKSIFRPEFINRFDAVTLFEPLSKPNLLKIAGLMFRKIKKSLKEKHIELIITEPLKEKIVELGYDPTFGARNMKRVIQDRVENVLARALLSGEIKRGDKIEIESENFTIRTMPPFASGRNSAEPSN